MLPYCQHLHSSMYGAVLCSTFRTRLEKHRKKVWTGMEMRILPFVSVMRIMQPQHGLWRCCKKKTFQLFLTSHVYCKACCSWEMQQLDFSKHYWVEGLAQELARCLSFSGAAALENHLSSLTAESFGRSVLPLAF